MLFIPKPILIRHNTYRYPFAWCTFCGFAWLSDVSLLYDAIQRRPKKNRLSPMK